MRQHFRSPKHFSRIHELSIWGQKVEQEKWDKRVKYDVTNKSVSLENSEPELTLKTACVHHDFVWHLLVCAVFKSKISWSNYSLLVKMNPALCWRLALSVESFFSSCQNLFFQRTPGQTNSTLFFRAFFPSPASHWACHTVIVSVLTRTVVYKSLGSVFSLAGQT